MRPLTPFDFLQRLQNHPSHFPKRRLCLKGHNTPPPAPSRAAPQVSHIARVLCAWLCGEPRSARRGCPQETVPLAATSRERSRHTFGSETALPPGLGSPAPSLLGFPTPSRPRGGGSGRGSQKAWGKLRRGRKRCWAERGVARPQRSPSAVPLGFGRSCPGGARAGESIFLGARPRLSVRLRRGLAWPREVRRSAAGVKWRAGGRPSALRSRGGGDKARARPSLFPRLGGWGSPTDSQGPPAPPPRWNESLFLARDSAAPPPQRARCLRLLLSPGSADCLRSPPAAPRSFPSGSRFELLLTTGEEAAVAGAVSCVRSLLPRRRVATSEGRRCVLEERGLARTAGWDSRTPVSNSPPLSVQNCKKTEIRRAVDSQNGLFVTLCVCEVFLKTLLS